MLTTRGLLFFVTSLAAAAAGLAFSNSTLSLVGLTLLGWFLASWLWFAVRVQVAPRSLSVVRRVSDERGAVDSLWAGRTYQVSVRLTNESGFDLPFVRTADRVPPGLQRVGDNSAIGGLASKQSATVTYQIGCSAAGRARFDGVSLQIADLQGFFTQRLFVQSIATYLILPPFADARGYIPTVKRHNLLPLLGVHAHRRPGTGSELLDIRDYLPGDPPKTISWKTSARRGRLMTKVFESEVPIRCTLFVDTSQSVRVGGSGKNALARLVEIVTAVAQASAAARDLTGLCLFDEGRTQFVRPARGKAHLIRLFRLLAEAASLAPSTAEAPVAQLLSLAYAVAQEVYPEWLSSGVNAMPFWLPAWAPQPAYTMRPSTDRTSFWSQLLTLIPRLALTVLRDMGRTLSGTFSARYRRRYRQRKQLAALLSVRYGLAPGGLAVLLEDDELLSHYLQRFLAEHQVPYRLPWYDAQGRYLFAAARKVGVLSDAFLTAVARGRDNELFVILADLLELGDELGPLLSAVKVALARHHQVMIVCPWPPEIPLPAGRETAFERKTPRKQGAPTLDYASLYRVRTVEALMMRMTTQRFHRVYHHLRRSFARLGVPVLCARDEEPVPLILNRLERLRVLERGMP